MKASEIKKLIISSADEKTDSGEITRILEDQGISYDFREGFSEKIINRLFGSVFTINSDLEFKRNLNYFLYRIAITGVAAIILWMITIFITQGSFSFNSLLGLGDGYDESIVYLLTGI
jgi:hypothetical protein